MRNTDRILTTHVGSLVRPAPLREAIRAMTAGTAGADERYASVLSDTVDELVGEQRGAGIDIVSDGEAGKGINWSQYVYERMGGLEHQAQTRGDHEAAFMQTSTDHAAFPEFWAEYAPSTGDSEEHLFGWTAVAPLTYAGQDVLARDIANLQAAVAHHGATEAFLPVVAPASASGIQWREIYRDEEEFLFALADVLHEEYRQILDAGLLLQVDDAVLPWMYDLMVPPGSLADYRAWAEVRIAAVNHALRGLPADRIRYHICWGSFNAPHIGDVALRDIVDLVLKVNAGSYLIEMANPRHAHEWQVWEETPLPDDKVLVPGLISHSTNVVEHPEWVCERLVRLAGIVGRERVLAGTDCGFAQGPFVARVHPSIQWAKLRALAEGAALATAKLWGPGRA